MNFDTNHFNHRYAGTIIVYPSTMTRSRIDFVPNLFVVLFVVGWNFPIASNAWTAARFFFSRSQQQQCAFTTTCRTRLFSSTNSSSSSSSSASDAFKIQRVLDLARQLGPVGSLRSVEEQDSILRAALELQSISEPRPAHIPLTDQIYDLLYSAATGASSGKLGYSWEK